MSDWTIDEILNFLELYQGEQCIWDPGNRGHKDKKKVADAWGRLSSSTGKSVKELKTKKDILMVTFRKHLKKKQDSIRSGAGIEDTYEPTWFAYQLMESFLLPIYMVKSGLNSETQSRSSEVAVVETSDEVEDMEFERPNPSTSSATTSFAKSQKINTDKSRRRTIDTTAAEQQMATAFGQLTNVLSQQRQRSNADSDDECDLYGKLLAKKMRELPKDERKIYMYEIDGLYIQKMKSKSSRETPSPPCFPSPRPSSGKYILVNRPPLAQIINDNNIRPTAVNILSNKLVLPRQNIIQSAYKKAHEDDQNNNTCE